MYGFKETQYSKMPGINSRLDELQAAILRVKLPRLDVYIERRRAIAAQYSTILGSTIKPVKPSSNAHHAYHQFVVKLTQRDTVKERLTQLGVATAIRYPWPIHTMSGFSDLNYKQGDLPVTESVANEILSLPIYPELKSTQVEQVCSTINQIVKELDDE
jgi:aminotransferase EvaB